MPLGGSTIQKAFLSSSKVAVCLLFLSLTTLRSKDLNDTRRLLSSATWRTSEDTLEAPCIGPLFFSSSHPPLPAPLWLSMFHSFQMLLVSFPMINAALHINTILCERFVWNSSLALLSTLERVVVVRFQSMVW